MRWSSCPVFCVAVSTVACRFTDVREMFRTQRWEMNWVYQWWICCANAKYNFTKLWCVVENTEKLLGRCTNCKVPEPPTNQTQVLLESHIPKVNGAAFPVASWKADTVGGKQGNKYKSSSPVHTSVSLVSEYKPQCELKLGGGGAGQLHHSASLSASVVV